MSLLLIEQNWPKVKTTQNKTKLQLETQISDNSPVVFLDFSWSQFVYLLLQEYEELLNPL